MTPDMRLMVKARMSLLLDRRTCFFGTLAMRLKLEEHPGIGSAGVDGKTLAYEPEFVRALTHGQRKGLMAHEVMHCALGHPMRLGARDFELFNVAADYAINLVLIDAGLELPPGGLIDEQYRGMSAEEIYARLKRDQASKASDDDQGNTPGNGGGQGEAQEGPSAPPSADKNFGGCGHFDKPSDAQRPAEYASAAEMEKLAQEWQAAATQAASMAKRAGDLPGSTAEAVEALNRPKVDWREALKRFVTAQARADYTWSPPNRRFIGSGIYLPSLHSQKIGCLVFAIDTSISMDVEALQQAIAELNAILDDVQPEEVHVLEADTAVHDANVYTPDNYPVRAMTLKGRGGTRFAPTFQWVKDHDIQPDCLIYFTDLECYDFGPEPEYPVLWASTNLGQEAARFGEVIKLID